MKLELSCYNVFEKQIKSNLRAWLGVVEGSPADSCRAVNNRRPHWWWQAVRVPHRVCTILGFKQKMGESEQLTKELQEGVRAGGHPEVWPGSVVEVQHLSLLLRAQVGQPQCAHVVVLARHEVDVGDGQLHRLAGHGLPCRGRPVLMALQSPLLNHSAMLDNDKYIFTEQQSPTCSAWWLLGSFVARPCSKSVLWWPEMNFVIKALIHPLVVLQPVEAPVWVYMIGQPRYMSVARRWYSPCWPPTEKGTCVNLSLWPRQAGLIFRPTWEQRSPRVLIMCLKLECLPRQGELGCGRTDRHLCIYLTGQR